MKPRIYKRGHVYWFCMSDKACAVGYTPALAYKHWQWLLARR